jgi:hypothetical protein
VDDTLDTDGTTIDGTTFGATVGSRQTLYCDDKDNDFDDDFQAHNDVWYSFTAGASGLRGFAITNTAGPAQNADWSINVYVDDDQLATGTLDDACGRLTCVGTIEQDLMGLNACADVEIVDGKTYYLNIASVGTPAIGDFTITVSTGCLP